VRAINQLIFAFGVIAFSGNVFAQTAPLPLPFSGTVNGFLTRGDWLLSVAPMASGDPRFAWSSRQRFDIDLAHYPRGRVNLFFDNEIVMGRERREFDFNHGNLMFETSALVQMAGIDAALVFHHVSRHLIDRPVDRVVAYHTVGGRVERVFAVGRSTVVPTAELHRVVQRTFVDYQWLSQFTLRADRPFDNGNRLFFTGSFGWDGVDPAVLGDTGVPLNREAQPGGRAEGGIHLLGRTVALDLYAAFERRVDGFPLARVPLSWIEAGFRLASPGSP
jgi:hypothetical protein